MDGSPRTALAWLALLVPIGVAQADPKAAALLAKARNVASSARTLQAVGTNTWQTGGQTGRMTFVLRLMKPNYGQVTVKRPNGTIEAQLICDGKTSYNVQPADKMYTPLPPEAGGLGEMLGFYAPIRAFYRPQSLTAGPQHRYAGSKRVNGKSYQVVTFTSKTPPEGPTRLFFRPDGLLEGMEIDIKQGDQRGMTSFWLKNVKLNAPMAAGQFAYKPPADFKPFNPNAGFGDLEASLLQEGADAPDFRLPTPDGSELSLTAARDGKKAVLINFWFYG